MPVRQEMQGSCPCPGPSDARLRLPASPAPRCAEIKATQTAGPVLLHVITEKGRGYLPAESASDKMHGVGQYDPVTGKPPAGPKGAPKGKPKVSPPLHWCRDLRVWGRTAGLGAWRRHLAGFGALHAGARLGCLLHAWSFACRRLQLWTRCGIPAGCTPCTTLSRGRVLALPG